MHTVPRGADESNRAEGAGGGTRSPRPRPLSLGLLLSILNALRRRRHGHGRPRQEVQATTREEREEGHKKRPNLCVPGQRETSLRLLSEGAGDGWAESQQGDTNVYQGLPQHCESNGGYSSSVSYHEYISYDTALSSICRKVPANLHDILHTPKIDTYEVEESLQYCIQNDTGRN